MSYNTLNFEVADGVATITLMRPDAGNSLNGEAFQEIWEASLACEEDPAIRAVLITATGWMFCSGGDLKDFAAKGDGLPRYLTESATRFHAAITRFHCASRSADSAGT